MRKIKQRHPETIEQAFGQVVCKYREKKGFSQMDMAVATGYSLRYVGDVERGNKSATMRTMNDLATLLGVQLGTLIVEAEKLLSANEKFRRGTSKTKQIRTSRPN